MATSYVKFVTQASKADAITDQKEAQAHSAVLSLIVSQPQAIHHAEIKTNGIIKLVSAVQKGRA